MCGRMPTHEIGLVLLPVHVLACPWMSLDVCAWLHDGCLGAWAARREIGGDCFTIGVSL